MSRRQTVGEAMATAELLDQFDRLALEVSSWCLAMLPCLRCGHRNPAHDDGLGRCWGTHYFDQTPCSCPGMVTSGRRPADDPDVLIVPTVQEHA